MSKKRINIMISPDVLKKVTKSAKTKNMSRSVFIENAAVELLNKPELKKAPNISYKATEEIINDPKFMVQEEDRPKYGAFSSNIKHYGSEEDCVISMKLLKDFGKTQKEEVIIKYVDEKRFDTNITIPGKDFVALIEKYRKERGI